jgi:LCP family protein required for cell wall assembly
MKKLFARASQFVSQNRRLSIVSFAVFALLSIVFTIAAFSFARRTGLAETGLFGLPIFAGSEGDESVLNPDALQVDPGIPLPDPWDGAERITILIMGLDLRDWDSGEGPPRTDTMILFTIDPIAKTAGMLSVPRDLWAVIPGFNPNKINTAYYFGELYSVPGGGPALAMKTVEQTIGVPIDYYAQIDFEAFIGFIDLIGGVKIDVPTAISVDPLGADTIPKNLQPGVQTLPGSVALAYARDRKSGGGDFARSQRQQQIVIGIRDRILDFNLLPGLIANSLEIFAELSSGIDTNLPLDDAIRLALLAAQIDINNIKRGIIGEDDIVYGFSPDELAILIPIPDKIREVRDEIFTGSSALSPLTPGSVEERMVAEGASISIQNGTSDTALGNSTQTYLAGIGANIVEVRGADTAYSQSLVIDHSGNPYTLAFLLEWMGLSNARIVHDFNPTSPIDVEVRLGSDWLAGNPLP